MATKIITVEATPPSESTGADYNKGAPLNAAEFDQNIVNLRAAVDRKASLNNPTFTGTVTLPSTTSIGDVSATELQYLNSVTSNVQDQINAKAPINNPTFTGTVSLSTGTANGVAYLNGSKALTSGSALTFDGTNLGTGGITFADASTQSTGGYTGFRNRIINGAMMIDQRNAGASVSLSGYTVFCTDRWKIQAFAGTAQRISSTLSAFAYSLKYTASGSNTYMQMGHQIEFLNCSDMQNQTVTISFRAKANNSNSGSTALTVRTRTGATVDGSVIFTGTNADTSVTITTSDAAYSVTRTLPATFGALSVEFVLGSHVSGDGLEITGIQLEKGSVATPFEFRPYGTELMLCQRYYFRTTVLVNSLTGGNATTGTTYPATMRATPTITGGGSGFTTAVGTPEQSYYYQTYTSGVNLQFSSEL